MFIWARQQHAAWEGYQLQKATFTFITIFILGMFTLQFVAFLLQMLDIASFSPGIANTAHISGGVVGYLLGRLNFFAWRQA